MNNIARIHQEDDNARAVEESMFASFHETSETLCTKLSELNRRLRKLARGILPVQIEAQGLQTALEELAAATDALPEITCRFESPEKVELSDNTVATHLYRIAQEAVTNAIRHSGSPELRISLSEEADKLVMEVEDQGGGFDLQEAIHREDAGLGLRAMEYRASLIGATLNIITKIDDGALVRCTLIKKGEANA
jgi:signal transduction histidine kinase